MALTATEPEATARINGLRAAGTKCPPQKPFKTRVPGADVASTVRAMAEGDLIYTPPGERNIEEAREQVRGGVAALLERAREREDEHGR